LNGSPIRSEGVPVPPAPTSTPRPERYPFDPADDLLILSSYGSSRKARSEVIQAIRQRHPTYPAYAIVRHARHLGKGAPPVKRAEWSAEDDERLARMIKRPLREIAQALGRTEPAVRGRLRRLDQDASFFNGWKTKELLEVFHVGESDVNRWIQSGWVTRRYGRITDASLLDLYRNHPGEIVIEQVERIWRDWLLRESRHACNST